MNTNETNEVEGGDLLGPWDGVVPLSEEQEESVRQAMGAQVRTLETLRRYADAGLAALRSGDGESADAGLRAASALAGHLLARLGWARVGPPSRASSAAAAEDFAWWGSLEHKRLTSALGRAANAAARFEAAHPDAQMYPLAQMLDELAGAASFRAGEAGAAAQEVAAG